MTDVDIVRESWRWHFHELLRAGQNLPEGATITEFHGDDEDFDQFSKDLEAGIDEQLMVNSTISTDWEDA